MRVLVRTFYLATLTAARFNPIIKTFYDRLREAGKPMKVARCACARKLLHIAFAVVTRQQPFGPIVSNRRCQWRQQWPHNRRKDLFCAT